LIDAARRQIDVAAARGNAALLGAGFHDAALLFGFLQDVAPDESPPPSLCLAARSVVGLGTRLGSLTLTERLEAARWSFPTCEPENRDDMALRWAEIIDRAVATPFATPAELDADSIRLVELMPQLPIVHYTRGRVLREASLHATDGRAELRAEARRELELARKATNYIRCNASHWLATMDLEDRLPLDEAVARLREDWTVHEIGWDPGYFLYATLLLRTGDSAAALDVLEQGQRAATARAAWFGAQAEALRAAIRKSDRQELEAVAERIAAGPPSGP
jgi:hypothetical protein